MARSTAKAKRIEDLPREIALAILIKDRGMTRERAENFLAIAKGEYKGDVTLLRN